MKRLWLYLILCLICHNLNAQKEINTPLHEFRGVWVATVANIDWPSQPGLSTEEQKRELLRILDHHQRLKLNAVMLQVRPAADAFFADGKELWSYYLSGKQGQAPDPPYDPLAFAVREAHNRSMELHAWFNPYRAAQDNDYRKRSPDHISRTRPEWFFKYGTKTYFNPGIPEVRDYIVEIILDVVRRYDIDGIHFDDYFYPYPGEEALPDSLTFQKYGADRFDHIEDWRRDNVDQLIRTLNEEIHKVKPHVKFGVSPFAIWRNQKEDPRGSHTNGFTSYDGLYADVYKWMKEGWMDYVNPQIYFPFHYPPAAFEKLLKWWDENNFGIQVLIGQAAYRALEGKNGWEDWSQLPRQVRELRLKEHIGGSVFFSSRSLLDNRAGFSDSLRTDLYRHQALPPPMPWIDSIAPPSAVNVRSTVIDRYVRLRWDWPEGTDGLEDVYGYVIYRCEEGGKIDFDSNQHVIALSFKPEEFYFDTSRIPGKNYRYAIRTLDRLKNLSEVEVEVEVKVEVER